MDYRLGYVEESFDSIIKQTSMHKQSDLYYQQYISLGMYCKQVKEELVYVSKRYADRPYLTMYLADENFGILKKQFCTTPDYSGMSENVILLFVDCIS